MYLIFDKPTYEENYEDYCAAIYNINLNEGYYTDDTETKTYADMFNPRVSSDKIRICLPILPEFKKYATKPLLDKLPTNW